MSNPQVTIETVTPELAAEWLVGNTHNRNLKEKAIARYAADIAAGQWDLNGESVKFNGDGRLLDGQNRLLAVIQAGKSIQTVVVRGVDAEAQETMDVGVPRKVADVLQLRGEVSCIDLSSALSQLWRFERDPQDMSATVFPTVHAALALLERHPSIRESVKVGTQLRKAIGFRGSVAIPLHYITTTIDASDAEAFWDRLLNGANLDTDDPIMALRSAVLSDRIAHHAKMTRVRLWALAVKAWNAYREGRKVKLLVWRPGGATPEGFPVPA